MENEVKCKMRVRIFGSPEDVGTLDLTGGKVDCTDPCYSRDTWCRKTGAPVAAGIYNCTVWHTDDGYTVSAMMITNTEQFKKKGRISGRKNFVGTFDGEIAEIGVDSGMAGFFVDKPDYDNEQWDTFCGLMRDHEYDFMVDDGVFCCSSGYGDGGYPVYSWENEQGETIGLLILFL